MGPQTFHALALRSYGRRKARPLSARKAHLLSELLPRLRLDLSCPAPEPLSGLFAGRVAEIWLEIGFGSGEHLLWQAERRPDIGLIGCEPFINGVASLLGEIERRDLKRVRVHDGDAREVLGWLPDASLERLFLLFPDPWPKKRHAKRRILSAETIAELARVLKQGGEFRFASDDGDYAGAALALLLSSSQFCWTAERADDWRMRPADWPETRYERKALAAGRHPAYLRFLKA